MEVGLAMLVEVASLCFGKVITVKVVELAKGSQGVSYWPVEVLMLATYPALGHVLVFRRYTKIPPSARCIPIWNYCRSCNLGSSVIETLQAVSCFLVLSVSCCLASRGACFCLVVVNASVSQVN